MHKLFENWRRYVQTLQEQEGGLSFYDLIDMAKPGDLLNLRFSREVKKGEGYFAPVVFEPGKTYKARVREDDINIETNWIDQDLTRDELKQEIKKAGGPGALNLETSTVTRTGRSAPLAVVMSNPQVLSPQPEPAPEEPAPEPVPEPAAVPEPAPEPEGDISVGMGDWYPEDKDVSKEESPEDWSQTTPEEAEAGISLDPERPSGPDLPVGKPEPAADEETPVDKMDIKQLKQKHKENTAAMKKAVADDPKVNKWSELPRNHPSRVNFRKTYTQLKKLNWGK